jgi:hypothetical protein
MAGTCTGPGPCDTSVIGTGRNWVTEVKGLPLYIRAIAHALLRHGHSEQDAIRLAVGTVHRWAAGKGGVTKATRARARAALAEWERKRAQAHSHDHSRSTMGTTLDLAASMAERLMPNREAVIRLAKRAEAMPAGAKRTRLKELIARRAHELHMSPDGDGDFDYDVPVGHGDTRRALNFSRFLPHRRIDLAGAPANTDTSNPANLNTAARRKLLKRGEAMPGPDGPRYPIRNRSDLEKAIRAVGRAKGDHAAIRAFIKRRAAALGALDMIPESWK